MLLKNTINQHFLKNIKLISQLVSLYIVLKSIKSLKNAPLFHYEKEFKKRGLNIRIYLYKEAVDCITLYSNQRKLKWKIF